MKYALSILVAGLILQTTTAAAQPSSQMAQPEAFLTAKYNPKMPGFFRLAPLVGGGLMLQNEGADKPIFGALMAGIGSGMFSFEAGVGYMSVPTTITVIENALPQVAAVNAGYLAFPMWAKYNYIEKPLASFFVKAGVIPLMLMTQAETEVELPSKTKATVELAESDLQMVAGVGGTAPLGSNSAFILDLSYFRGTVPTTVDGSINQGALISLGVSFDL